MHALDSTSTPVKPRDEKTKTTAGDEGSSKTKKPFFLLGPSNTVKSKVNLLNATRKELDYDAESEKPATKRARLDEIHLQAALRSPVASHKDLDDLSTSKKRKRKGPKTNATSKSQHTTTNTTKSANTANSPRTTSATSLATSLSLHKAQTSLILSDDIWVLLANSELHLVSRVFLCLHLKDIVGKLGPHYDQIPFEQVELSAFQLWEQLLKRYGNLASVPFGALGVKKTFDLLCTDTLLGGKNLEYVLRREIPIFLDHTKDVVNIGFVEDMVNNTVSRKHNPLISWVCLAYHWGRVKNGEDINDMITGVFEEFKPEYGHTMYVIIEGLKMRSEGTVITRARLTLRREIRGSVILVDCWRGRRAVLAKPTTRGKIRRLTRQLTFRYCPGRWGHETS